MRLVCRHLHTVHISLLHIDHVLPLWLHLGLHLVLWRLHVLVATATPSSIMIATVVVVSIIIAASVIIEFAVVLTAAVAVVAAIEDLVKVIVLERFTLKNKVGESPANLAKNTPSTGSVADATTILRRKVWLHCFD